MPSGDYFMQERQRHVRSQAEQAPIAAAVPPTIGPGTARPSGPDTFRVVTLESPPTVPLDEDPRLRGLGGLTGLSGQWLERAGELLESVDSMLCWRCGCGVGFCLAGDADEQIRWVEASLVAGDASTDPVSVQCEECAPATCPEPWPAERPAGWMAMRPDHCWTAPDGFTRVHVHDPGAQLCRCGGTARTGIPS